MTRSLLRVALTLGLATLPCPPLAAQDVEMVSQVTGLPLPRAYYDRVTERPDFFEIERGWRQRTARLRAAGQPVTGTLPVVVVLALFSDSPDPRFSHEDVQRTLFDGPSPNGTLTEFYRETSGGALTVHGQVLPWVRTGVTLAQVVGDNFGLGGTQTGVYLTQALQLVDPTTDFGQFDNDGPDGVPNSGDDDGFADAVAFQFLEPAASCPGPGIWPHRASLAAWTGEPFATDDRQPSGDPIFVSGYLIQSTVECGGTEIQNAATIAHEMGHVLGLPDLYDNTEGILPENRSWVLGCWSLMAAGAWGCGSTQDRSVVRRPPHLGAWEKIQLGWADVTVVGATADSVLLLEPSRTTGQMLQVPLSTTEYLLLEYRDKQGFDQDLPAAGVLVYRVDEKRLLRPCRSCPRIYRLQLLEADDNGALVRNTAGGGNRGEAGDVFGDQVTRLTSGTLPSTRLSSGAPTSVALHRITLEGGHARIELSTVDRELGRLVGSLLEIEQLSEEESAFLDRVGNANGRYDVADLRRYLRDHPLVRDAVGATAR